MVRRVFSFATGLQRNIGGIFGNNRRIYIYLQRGVQKDKLSFL